MPGTAQPPVIVSGIDLRLIFGRLIAEVVTDVDCGLLNVQRYIRLGLTDSNTDDKVYGDCPDGGAWVIEQVWLSTGASEETAGIKRALRAIEPFAPLTFTR